MENGPVNAARRANLEDVPRLRALWNSHSLPTKDLEKRFTAFQVLEAANGEIISAVELRVEGVDGFLDSVAWTDAAPENHAAALFSRVLQLARNRGLCRLWVAGDGGFASIPWSVVVSAQGFIAWEGDGAGVPPVAQGRGGLRVLKLREETATGLTLEQEFELFAKAQRKGTQRVLGVAKFMHLIAWLAVLIAGSLVGMLIYSVIKTGVWRF